MVSAEGGRPREWGTSGRGTWGEGTAGGYWQGGDIGDIAPGIPSWL